MGHKYIKTTDVFSTSENGAVPKPTPADVTANKVLRADGAWVPQSGGGGGGGTHTYSTTEQVVGTWIDGSDIYENVFSGTFADMNATSVVIDLGLGGVGWILNAWGFLVTSDHPESALPIGKNFNESFSSVWFGHVANDNVTVVRGGAGWHGNTPTAYVVLQYIKQVAP